TDEDGRDGTDGAWTGHSFRVAGARGHAGGSVSGHRAGRAVPVQLGHGGLDRPGGHPSRPDLTRFAPGVGAYSGDRLLRRVRHARVLETAKTWGEFRHQRAIQTTR